MERRTFFIAAPVFAVGFASLYWPGIGSAGPVGGQAQYQQVEEQPELKVAAAIKPYLSGKPQGTCTLSVPSKVRLGSAGLDVPLRATGGCAQNPGLRAIWYVGTDLATADAVALFNGSATSTWTLMHHGSLGTYTWKGSGAVDSSNRAHSQNSPTTTVKVVSYAGLKISRVAGKTILNTRVIRFGTTNSVNVPYSGKAGLIQYREIGASTWKGLKNVASNSQGLYTYGYPTSAKREYRVIFGESTYVWGSVSPTRVG